MADNNRIAKVTVSMVEQLKNLAVAVGKLGISAEEDVMEFVRAGNINVALGEDLGDDTINNLAKLNDILGKRPGVVQALLATGSAINELVQSSTANEGYTSTKQEEYGSGDDIQDTAKED